MTFREFEIVMLALRCWQETKDLDEALAIACAIRNRVFNWTLSYSECLEQHESFASVVTVVVAKKPASTDEFFNTLLQQIETVYNNDFADVTMGSTYYCRPQDVAPGSWFATEILAKPDEHPLRAQVGSKQFYA